MCMLPHLLSNVGVVFASERSLGHAEAVIAEMQTDRLICLAWGSVQFADY